MFFLSMEFDEALCETCGQPLFIDKEECREFLEGKMKQGFIVCSCCGVSQDSGQEEKKEPV
jgi:RNase P subunit RPR2